MAEQDRSSDADFRKRSQEIRQHVAKRGGLSFSRYEKPPDSYAGWAYRIGMELVVAVVASVFIGVSIDQYFGTTPWALIGMFLLGSLAGLRNIFRLIEYYQKETEEERQMAEQTAEAARRRAERDVDGAAPEAPASGLMSARYHLAKGAGRAPGDREVGAETSEDADQDKGRTADGYVDRL